MAETWNRNILCFYSWLERANFTACILAGIWVSISFGIIKALLFLAVWLVIGFVVVKATNAILFYGSGKAFDEKAAATLFFSVQFGNFTLRQFIGILLRAGLGLAAPWVALAYVLSLSIV